MKKSINKVWFFGLFVVLFGIISGCGSSGEVAKNADSNKSTEQVSKAKGENPSTSADQEVVSLNLAHHLGPDATTNIAYLELAEIVKEKTNNTLQISVFPNGQMGDAREVIEGVMLGTVDMGMASHALLSSHIPEYGIFDLPFMFSGYTHLGKVLDSDIVKEIDKKLLEQSGVRSLGWSFAGFRDVITRTKPIREFADFEGMKLRVPESTVYVETFKATEARPTPIPWGETYTALETGVVDGLENSPVSLTASKMYEPAKYYTVTGHMQSSHTIIINEEKWQSLSSEHQKAIEEAVAIIMPKAREAIQIEDQEAIDEMKEYGLEFIKIKDPENMVKAVNPIWNEYAKDLDGGLEIINKIQELK
jgi:tripartite ATP-independent transporter DctP family solute receptor